MSSAMKRRAAGRVTSSLSGWRRPPASASCSSGCLASAAVRWPGAGAPARTAAGRGGGRRGGGPAVEEAGGRAGGDGERAADVQRVALLAELRVARADAQAQVAGPGARPAARRGPDAAAQRVR